MEGEDLEILRLTNEANNGFYVDVWFGDSKCEASQPFSAAWLRLVGEWLFRYIHLILPQVLFMMPY